MKYRSPLYFMAFALALMGGCATLNYQKVPKPERKRYFELAAVSSQKAADEYAALADSTDREMFWRKFWKEKDPTPTTQGNERYDEHLRRVAYADTFFPQLITFWDDRGRTYIRYGEPDYREVNPMGDALYGHDPFDVSIDADIEKGSRRKISGTYGWEKWTYSQLAQTFSFLQRDVGYFLVRDLDAAKSGIAAATIMSMQAIDAPMPTLSDTMASDLYRHDYGQPLNFPFDLARFAARGKAEVWISYSIPLGKIDYDTADGRGLLNRSIVIFDENMAEVGRDEKVLTPEAPGDQMENPQAQLVDLAKFHLSPGGYSLAISLMDLNSGKTGIYKYKFPIIDYKAEAQETSDLLLCSDIRQDSSQGRFSRGGYRLIPQPGRSFKKGRDLYFYCELYNLKYSPAQPRILRVRYLIFPKKGNKARASRQELVPAGSQTTALASGLAVSDLPAGDYILVVEIRDQNDGKVKNVAASFRIHM